jgi:hypothetical protein
MKSFPFSKKKQFIILQTKYLREAATSILNGRMQEHGLHGLPTLSVIVFNALRMLYKNDFIYIGGEYFCSC